MLPFIFRRRVFFMPGSVPAEKLHTEKFMKPLTIAVSDYETDVVRAVFKGLQEARVPVEDIIPLSSDASEYDTVSFMDQDFPIVPLQRFDFGSADAVLVSGVTDDAGKTLIRAVEAGIPVLDFTNFPAGGDGLFARGGNPKESFWNPEITPVYYPANSGAMLLSGILKPLADKGLLCGGTVTLIEPASELQNGGVMDLGRETAAVLNLRPVVPKVFATQLAFNLHPVIGDLLPGGSTVHEAEIIAELNTLVPGFPSSLSLTCILAPVFHGCMASITLNLSGDTDQKELERIISVPGTVRFVTEKEGELTPIPFARDEPEVLISRLRMINPRTCSFVALSDNETRGMAGNAVELLRLLSERR